MKVEIIVDPTRIPPPPLSTRVTPAKIEAPVANRPAKSAAAGEAGSVRRGGAGRGGGRRGRGGRGGRNSRPVPTAEELDKELEEWNTEKDAA